MVGDNTKPADAVQGELAFSESAVGDNTKPRSPLLPVRHQRDFFVCDIFDAAVKGDAASMEHPIFSLSKKPDLKVRRYENGDKWAEIRPSIKGLATVFDRDVLIYCISQLVAALKKGAHFLQVLCHQAAFLFDKADFGSVILGNDNLSASLNGRQGTRYCARNPS